MTDVNKMTIYCTRCGRMYDPEKPHDCADRTAFTHGLDLFYDPAVILADANANGIKYEAEKVMDPILRRWFAIDLDPVDAERNAENAAVDLSWHMEEAGLLAFPVCRHAIYHSGCDSCNRRDPESCACGFPDRHTNLPCGR